tara:strand:- start:190 stop:609 length:420 start_codon:yes stop_codon:yes gene_type:complete
MALFEIGMDKGTFWATKKNGRICDLKKLVGQSIVEGKISICGGVLKITGKRHKIKDVHSYAMWMGRRHITPLKEMEDTYFVNKENVRTASLIESNGEYLENGWPWAKRVEVEYYPSGTYVCKKSSEIKLATSNWIYKEK